MAARSLWQKENAPALGGRRVTASPLTTQTKHGSARSRRLAAEKRIAAE